MKCLTCIRIKMASTTGSMSCIGLQIPFVSNRRSYASFCRTLFCLADWEGPKRNILTTEMYADGSDVLSLSSVTSGRVHITNRILSLPRHEFTTLLSMLWQSCPIESFARNTLSVIISCHIIPFEMHLFSFGTHYALILNSPIKHCKPVLLWYLQSSHISGSCMFKCISTKRTLFAVVNNDISSCALRSYHSFQISLSISCVAILLVTNCLN